MVNQYFRPVVKIASKPRKTLVTVTDSVLKFSTEIYIFIKQPKNWDFLYFLIDSPVQCFPEKAKKSEGSGISRVNY